MYVRRCACEHDGVKIEFTVDLSMDKCVVYHCHKNIYFWTNQQMGLVIKFKPFCDHFYKENRKGVEKNNEI